MQKLIIIVSIFCSMIFHADNSFAQINKTLSKDSLKNTIKQALKIDTSGIKNTVNGKIKNVLDTKLNQIGLANLVKKDTGKVSKKVQFKDFSVENVIQYIQSGPANSSSKLLNNVAVSGQLEIFRFPVNLDMISRVNSSANFNPVKNDLFKFDLDKPQLNQFYQPALNKYKDLIKNKFSGLAIEDYLKKGIQDRLMKNLPESISKDPKIQSLLNDPKAIGNLLSLDDEKLKNKLTETFSDAKKQAKGYESAVQKNPQGLDPAIQSTVTELSQYIQSVRKEIHTSGLDEKTIVMFQKFIENQVSDEDLTEYFINQLSEAPGLEKTRRFYSKIKDFQIGNFGYKLPGAALNQDLFLNGFNTIIKTSRGPVTLGVATSKEIAPKDIGFTGSDYSYPKLFSYISVPATNFSFGKGKLSWIGVYDKEFDKSSSVFLNSIPQNNLVFTLSQNLNVNRLGILTVDISKSATQYKDLLAISPDLVILDQSTRGNYYKDDMLETMSVGLNHEIDSRKLGLKSNVYFNYAGSGFQNPGQQGLSNMSMRLGGNIKQSFLKNKVTINLRSDVRETPISAENNAHWQNYTYQSDLRFRISKSSSFNLKYIQNGVNKVAVDRAPVYSSQKLQADFSASYKIGKYYSFSYLTLGNQMMSTTGITQQPNFMLFNYTQNLVLKNFSVNGNVFYNRESGKVALLGNMLSTDLAFQYDIKALRLSSGGTYLNNGQMAKQLGIKQNIQCLVKKHFDINASLDLRKNLINPVNPDLFSTTRADFSIRYYIDKQ